MNERHDYISSDVTHTQIESNGTLSDLVIQKLKYLFCVNAFPWLTVTCPSHQALTLKSTKVRFTMVL